MSTFKMTRNVIREATIEVELPDESTYRTDDECIRWVGFCAGPGASCTVAVGAFCTVAVDEINTEHFAVSSIGVNNIETIARFKKLNSNVYSSLETACREVDRFIRKYREEMHAKELKHAEEMYAKEWR